MCPEAISAGALAYELTHRGRRRSPTTARPSASQPDNAGRPTSGADMSITSWKKGRRRSRTTARHYGSTPERVRLLLSRAGLSRRAAMGSELARFLCRGPIEAGGCPGHERARHPLSRPGSLRARRGGVRPRPWPLSRQIPRPSSAARCRDSPRVAMAPRLRISPVRRSSATDGRRPICRFGSISPMPGTAGSTSPFWMTAARSRIRAHGPAPSLPSIAASSRKRR